MKRLLLMALGIMGLFHTTEATVSPIINQQELCAAVLVSEAGGEGIIGMKAVMEVIRQRMAEHKYSLKKVLLEKNAFTAITPYRKNLLRFVTKMKRHPQWYNALNIVNNYKGKTLTKNANYYHERTVKPIWSRGEKPVAIIGNHLFFALSY